MILRLLTGLGAILGFVFFTLSIASGLYYLSEIIEEHSVPAKRFLLRLIWSVIGLHILLIFDSFPKKLTIFSIVSHLLYRANLSTFPVIQLLSPTFLLSCSTFIPPKSVNLSLVIVFTNHYLWFRHFSYIQSHRIYTEHPTFPETASFFVICVWLVPFGLFISLSAGENILPTIGSDGRIEGKKRTGLVKLGIEGVKEWFERMSVFERRRSRYA
ncbi:Protein SVP26 [Neolecta irregularis DAH-3]|uniref:Protein SVP26 n=1 Tax=Neolecta irregularis (strain DAH-3) TaxID=1198029 RepID=A0A1U7LS27_NEOID|nr:Protein SVP26 [Neolecta irregularis DAH-3]|eukprot:OLL25476.1 Protein SVP26 [Neolecta irregularis DAH-3]